MENGFASSHFWSSTQNGNYQNQFVLKVYDDSQEIKLGNQGLNDGVVLRLIKGD